jgi:tetratricopeptide (TPR) repeat protein
MTAQYAYAGRVDEAIEEAKKAHDLDPALVAPMADLSNLYMVQGKPQESVEWYLKMLGSQPSVDPARAVALRRTFERGGIKEFLRARIAYSLEQIRGGKGPAPIALVQTYAFLGDRDEAVRWLEKAVEQRQSTVIFVNLHPMYASLRDHPGFQEIVRKIGL